MPLQTKNQSAVIAETKQVGKFGLIGVINTLLDFGVYNVMIVFAGLTAIPANFISTTAAMSFSFIANKTFVFRNKNRNYLTQAVIFLAVTAFGLYVLQNSVIYFLLHVWQGPLEFGHAIVRLLGLGEVFSRNFVFTNGAKAFATLFSLTWNYLMYKKVVFKE